MDSVSGHLGDTHPLSAHAREYANVVVFGDEWSLGPAHVDLTLVTFETSTRMKRKHGVCRTTSDRTCTIRLSNRTAERAGIEAIEETVRHELVHAYQHQDADATMGHGASFERWVEPLALSGRCSEHYRVDADDYAFSFHCPTCGFIGGRYRMCKAVRAGLSDALRCRQCGSGEIDVRDRRKRPLADASENES